MARDHNEAGSDEYTGFRLTTLWQPTNDLDITLGYLQQEIDQDGQPEVDLSLGDYQQRVLNTGIDGSSDELLGIETDITSLVVNYDLGWASITSASSWIQHDSTSEQDSTFIFWNDIPVFYDNSGSVDVFAEEFRVSSQLDGSLQFVTGLYYEDRQTDRHALAAWSGEARANTRRPPYINI